MRTSILLFLPCNGFRGTFFVAGRMKVWSLGVGDAQEQAVLSADQATQRDAEPPREDRCGRSQRNDATIDEVQTRPPLLNPSA